MIHFARLLLISLLLWPAMAAAQTTDEAWSVRHKQIEKRLTDLSDRSDLSQQQPGYYTGLRTELQPLEEELQVSRATAWEEAQQAKVLLDALGPPPEEGEAPEPKEIAEERDRLRQSMARFDGRVGLVDVLIARAQQLRQRISEMEAQTKAEGLLARDTSLLQLEVWIRAFGQIPWVVTNLTEAVSKRAVDVGRAMTAGASAIMLAALIGAVIVGWPLRRILIRSFGQGAVTEVPSYARRLLAAVAEAVARGLMPALAALFVFVAVRSLDVLPERELGILRVGLAVGAVLYISLAALRATLSAGSPRWRLLWMDDADAIAFSRRATAFGSAVGLSYFLLYAGNALALPDEIEKVIEIALRLVVALTLLLLLDRRFWPDAAREETDDDAEVSGDKLHGDARRSSPWWRLTRLFAIFLILVNPLLVGAGYSTLANWIFYSLITSGGVIAGLWVVHRLVHDVVTLLFSTDRSTIASLRATIISTETVATRTRFWLIMMVDAALVLLGVPAIMLVWGMDPGQLKELVDAALFGFSVGDMEISIAGIGYAILVFILFVVGTRIIQRFLERQILPHTGLDSGAQNSIKTGFGYIGLIIAALAATSAIGINLQNLALIAGALSVGIGFGLQNVVNNFVSGLILLVERPIKVGDWVVVGTNEGIVKRISVRATEIVTFQKASVIIPNSELISGVVQNWTLQDASARIDVPVGVAYGSDVRQVSDLLLKCLRSHPKARRFPEPSVIFAGFGESSLDFVARVHISNALDRISILSDLNHAINDSFVKHGIEIPFPQRDLHLRSTGDLAQVLRGQDTDRPPSSENAPG